MNEREFNEYCAKVMGYKRGWKGKKEVFWLDDEGKRYLYLELYNPYNDLNQMAEVVEKLLEDADIYIKGAFPNKYMFDRDGVKQAIRDFIISTMEKDNE